MQNEILIIGAGAAGLMAARELSQQGLTVQVIEARSRIGGRVHTITGQGFSGAVETGAEFIHGDLELTLQLLREAGLKATPAEGERWRSKNGRLFQQTDFTEGGEVLQHALEQQQTETSVGAFLQQHFGGNQYEDLKKSVQGYVEGYYAGDLDRASVLSMKEEWMQEEAPQHRVASGYTALLHFLYEECRRNGVSFAFDAPVTQLTWAFEKVEINIANGQQYSGKQAIITVPTPLLLSNAAIYFQPQPTKHFEALAKLGFGDVIKVLVEFNNAFWSDEFHLDSLGFLLSEETIPTWWTQYPERSRLLVGWCAGPNARRLKDKTEAEIFKTAMQSLAHVFQLPVTELTKKVLAWNVCNWAADPFTRGGYSYITTTTKTALETLSHPVEDTLYFAGEAYYNNINTGTVEAALQNGRQVAQQLLQTTARG